MYLAVGVGGASKELLRCLLNTQQRFLSSTKLVSFSLNILFHFNELD